MLVRGRGLVPTVVEGEYGTAPGPDGDALGKLGRRLKKSAERVGAAVAVVYPVEGRDWRDANEVRARLLAGQPLAYAAWTGEGGTETRWPETGWIGGDAPVPDRLGGCHRPAPGGYIPPRRDSG